MSRLDSLVSGGKGRGRGTSRRGRRRADGDRPEAPEKPRTGGRRALLEAIRRLPQYLRLLAGLMTDGRVSRLDRLFVVAAIAYIVSPLDFVPDVVPFLGQVDDVFLLAMALQRLVSRAGKRVVMRYWRDDPRALSEAALAELVAAATFFLPRRVTRRVRRLVFRR